MKTLTMLVGLLVVASNAVGEDKVVKRSDAEKKAIAAIEKLGGKVKFDDKKPEKPVTGVNLSRTKVTDAGLVHLKGLTKLQGLGLSATKVTDVGLVHLSGLTELQTLALNNTKVADAGLVHHAARHPVSNTPCSGGYSFAFNALALLKAALASARSGFRRMASLRSLIARSASPLKM